MLGTVTQDVRFALRTFVRAPGFTAACLLTLALGIGATTTIFSVVDGVLLRPLPFEGADRLVQVGSRFGEIEVSSNSPADYFDIRSRARSFEALAGTRMQWMDMTASGEPERFDAAGVTASYFDVLGVRPALGRAFRPEDDTPAGEAVLVLSHGLWQRRFGSEPAVLGRALTLNGRSYTVVGVMPAGFEAPAAIYHQDVELWFPLGQVDDDLQSRGDAFIQVIGRLAAGATETSALAELQAIGRSLEELYPSDDGGRNYWLASLHERTVGDIGSRLYVLLGAVGFLLLIACANVANLFLARATDRTREIGVRSALGAGRRRIAAQLLTEGVVMAIAGGALGVATAWVGLRAFKALSPGEIPRLSETTIDVRVLGFAVALSIVTGLLFGLAPAVRAGRDDLGLGLREGAASSGRRRSGLRGAIVVAQVAIALVLLTGAGLLINSFVRLMRVEPGFDARTVVWMDVDAPRRLEDATERTLFFERVRERLAALPGAGAVGAIHGLPLDRNRSITTVLPEGVDPSRESGPPRIPHHSATPGYFEALGVPLRGRDFAPTDRADAPPVVIVSETFARRYWPGESAVGKRVRVGDVEAGPWATVVGVAGDVRHYGLAQELEPMLYRPLAQFPRSRVGVVVRDGGDPASLLPAMRSAVWELDPTIPLDEFGTMEAQVSASLVEPRFYTALLAGFGGMAVALAFVGLYGTLSYTVHARRRELGIRLALGAAGHDVRRLVVAQGLRLAGIGIAIGALGAMLASRVLEALVFGVTPRDPATFAAVAGAMLLVAAAACWLPARRAAATDPIRTLRAE